MGEIEKLNSDLVNLDVLIKSGVVKRSTKFVKVILSGQLTSVVKLSGLTVSKGAKDLIEKAGGSVE